MALAEGQARAAIHGEPAPDVEADAAIGREMRAAWRYLAKKGRRPKGVVDYVIGVGDYLRIKDEWLSDVGQFKRTHPQFTRLWFVLRMCCENCDSGYMVVRKRRDWKYRFAGCSTYNASGCDFTLGSRDYARRKAETVLAIMCDVAPEHRFLIRDRSAS